MMSSPNAPSNRVCVFAPAPLLTVTLETAEGADDTEIHLHAGGQGFWIARLVEVLGAEVVLCSTFGGETGRVVRGLLEDEPLTLRSVGTGGWNGCYVDDRRSGERERVGEMSPTPLTRHEVDELYGAVLVAGLDATLTVLAGAGLDPILPSDVYRRLTADLAANGRPVVVDLSGEPLRAAVAGGASVVKVSHEDLLRDRQVEDGAVPALADAMSEFADHGAQLVVCSRAEQPALALFHGRVVEVCGPVMEATEHRGAGDSFTAALAAALAAGQSFEDALKLGAAAGALNVTRRGLGTGAREEIERLAELVEIRDAEVAAGGR
jgi:1-phosphofructokinase